MENTNKQLASQKVIDYILNQIQSGSLKKGSRLPTEFELSELLGVSRIPLREALCSLRTVGILEARQGGGTYVTSRCDPTILGRMLYDYAVLENVDLFQIIDVRTLLEPECARQAALQATQNQREDILNAAKAYAQLMENYQPDSSTALQVSELDSALHRLIAVASHNEFLYMMLSVTGISFAELNRRSTRDSAEMGIQGLRNIAQMHLALAQAIYDGDASAAKKLMEKHLRQIRLSYSEHP